MLEAVVESFCERDVRFGDSACFVARESDFDLAPADRDVGVVKRLLSDTTDSRGEADSAEIAVELVGPDDFIASALPRYGYRFFDFFVC